MDKIETVLTIAAECLEGALNFNITTPENQSQNITTPKEQTSAAGIGDAVQMSCFPKATEMTISLGYLSIHLPPFGRFEKLTALRLNDV
ncbi:hypothetical protein E2562_023854 [Oryza meyeriana var. granulata]|uniref:Uncharacterized protein n=1 Tax=Oryza meyeriana var. granulata TaxID=110450 RepID=A0A6G1D7F2_9ORYZ|nr:hypothetical protein E2562_023854 [Oryza meyeriana var. granulata]